MGPVPALPVTQDYIKIAASAGPPQYQVQISSYGIRGTAWWSGLFPSHAKVTGEGSKTESPPALIFFIFFFSGDQLTRTVCEPAWPSGKALGWYKQKDLGSIRCEPVWPSGKALGW